MAGRASDGSVSELFGVWQSRPNRGEAVRPEALADCKLRRSLGFQGDRKLSGRSPVPLTIHLTDARLVRYHAPGVSGLSDP
jgi:hypothetical protein